MVSLIVCFGYKPRSFAAINKPKNKLKKPHSPAVIGFFIPFKLYKNRFSRNIA